MIIVSGEAKRAARRAAMQITPRQLFIGMAQAGFISAEEAVAAATSGVMPAAVEAVVATLTDSQQVAARITWARMSIVLRTDPLVDLLAASQGLAPEAVDAFFLSCAAI